MHNSYPKTSVKGLLACSWMVFFTSVAQRLHLGIVVFWWYLVYISFSLLIVVHLNKHYLIVISSDLLKVFTLSPSEVDVYWNPSDFIDVKYYTLFHREHSEDDDTVFQTIRPDATLSSYVIENLKPNTLYDFKFEAMANEGYRIITEASQIKTCKPG